MTAIAVAVLLGLRIWQTGLLGDELLFVHAIDLGATDGLFASGSSHPPLVRLLVSTVGNGNAPDWLLRLPSLNLAVATIFVWNSLLKQLVPDRWLIALLLPALALSPVWLEQAFQCLPYSALTFFASLHCLAWMKWTAENQSPRSRRHWLIAFLASGIALPWTHFFGIFVLLTDQFVWLTLIMMKKCRPRDWLWMNSVIATLTLPVIPIAAHYLDIEKTFSIYRIADYDSYFLPASSYFFSHLTFSTFTTTWPIFLIVDAVAALFVIDALRHSPQPTNQDELRTSTANVLGIIAVSFLLAGFTAAQLQSWLRESAMWPRYMLTGAWIHLPLTCFLLWRFVGLSAARCMAAFGLCCALIGTQSSLQVHGTDTHRVASELQENWQQGDQFLEQGVDIWTGENHFDRLWFRRYVSDSWPVASLPAVPREHVLASGFDFSAIPHDCQRIWVFSHLFNEKFHLRQQIPGWKLAAAACYGDACPLALYVRNSPPTGSLSSTPIVSITPVSPE